MTRTIALTGATGFIGQHVQSHAADLGWQIRSLTRRDPAAKSVANVEWIRGSLDDAQTLKTLCQGADAVVHCAGAIKATTPNGFFKTNVGGTETLAHAAAQMGCRKMVYLSSLAAREPSLSDYAASKRKSEEVLSENANMTRWTILRPPAVYGPGDRETLKVFRFMKHGIALVPGSIRNRTSFIHLHDLSRAVVACVDAEAVNQMTIELRDDQAGGYDWRQICEAATAAFGRAVSCLTLPQFAVWPVALLNETLSHLSGRPAILTRGKLREMFHEDWSVGENVLCAHTDWRPEYDLPTGFAQTVNWYQEAGWL